VGNSTKRRRIYCGKKEDGLEKSQFMYLTWTQSSQKKHGQKALKSGFSG